MRAVEKDIAQQHDIDLKKGGGHLNPQTPPGTLRLIWAPPPLIPSLPLCSGCEPTRACGAFISYGR
jgi:hypothetical protein